MKGILMHHAFETGRRVEAEHEGSRECRSCVMMGLLAIVCCVAGCGVSRDAQLLVGRDGTEYVHPTWQVLCEMDKQSPGDRIATLRMLRNTLEGKGTYSRLVAARVLALWYSESRWVGHINDDDMLECLLIFKALADECLYMGPMQARDSNSRTFFLIEYIEHIEGPYDYPIVPRLAIEVDGQVTPLFNEWPENLTIESVELRINGEVAIPEEVPITFPRDTRFPVRLRDYLTEKKKGTYTWTVKSRLVSSSRKMAVAVDREWSREVVTSADVLQDPRAEDRAE